MMKIFRKLLRIVLVRNFVSIIRAFWFIQIKRVEILTAESSEEVHNPTVFSNKRRIVRNKTNPHPTAKYWLGIDTDQASPKSDLLISPIKSIYSIRDKFPKLKVLSIGPRTEGEILNLLSHGFQIENISAVDLITYSPWINLGNMHNLDFADNTFDIVICGWVIAYSDDKRKAASEIARVLKSGGIASLGVSYSPRSNEQIIEERGYLIATEDRLNSTDAILELFENRIKHVYFNSDIEESARDKYGQLIVIFSVI